MKNFDTGTTIAVVALLTGLGFIFNLILSPVKKDIARIDTEIQELKIGQKDLKSDISEIKELLSSKKSQSTQPNTKKETSLQVR